MAGTRKHSENSTPQTPGRAALRAAGYKATPGRLALLDVLIENKKPLGIDSITRRLKERQINMNKVTAYRTLAMLEKIGLVRRVDLRHGHADYEMAGREDHHHLICVTCGKIEDFGDCNLDSLARKALRQSKDFARVDQHALEFFGLCNKCATKTAK